MDKFYEQFKHNLENQPIPDFEEQDWADMRQRLDGQTAVAPRAINYWGWAVAALILGIIGSNWLIISQLEQANKKISRLELQMDTIVQTKIIYRTDTIFEKVGGEQFRLEGQKERVHNLEVNQITESVINKTPTSNFSKRTNPNKQATSFNLLTVQTKEKQAFNRALNKIGENSDKGKSSIAIIRDGLIHLEKEQIESTAIQASNKSKNNVGISALSLTEKKLAELPLLNNLNFSNNIIDYNKRPLPPSFETPILSTVSNRRKKTFQQYIYPMRPRAIQIGTTIGLGIIPSSNYSHVDLNSYGMIANIKFGQPWRFWISANHTHFKYEAEEFGEESGIPFIEAPWDNLKLEEAKVNRAFWSFNAGLQYNFRMQKKLQPYVGMGFGSSYLVKNEVLYEFEAEHRKPSVLEKRTFGNAKNLQYAILKTGLAYSLTKKWTLQLEGDYLYQTENKSKNNQLPNMLNGQLSVLYTF